jgi:ribosome-associated protein
MKNKTKATAMELKDFIVERLEYGKGVDIKIIETKSKSDLADFIIVVTGTSGRHVAFLGESVAEDLKHNYEMNSSGIRIEGLQEASWVLLDAGSVLVHVFKPETRERYRIEDIWEKKQ